MAVVVAVPPVGRGRAVTAVEGEVAVVVERLVVGEVGVALVAVREVPVDVDVLEDALLPVHGVHQLKRKEDIIANCQDTKRITYQPWE